jgi:hypothetical protein
MRDCESRLPQLYELLGRQPPDSGVRLNLHQCVLDAIDDAPRRIGVFARDEINRRVKRVPSRTSKDGVRSCLLPNRPVTSAGPETLFF